MGAIKSIFDNIGNIFKKTAKAVPAPKAAVKSLDSSAIKTSSKISGSAATVISGGQEISKPVAKTFSQGVTGTGNIAGKLFKTGVAVGGVGAIGGGAVFGATKLYDYVGDTWAITTQQREYENQLGLMDKEREVTKKAQDEQIDYMIKLQELRNAGQNSSTLGASGGSGSNLFPVGSSIASEDSSSSNTMWYVILALGVLAAGSYVYSKSRSKK